MAMITDASAGLGHRGRGAGVCSARCCGSRPRRWIGSANGWARRSPVRPDLIYRSTGSVIVTGHGQGRAGRPEAGGDPGLNRHPGLSAASGRGRARRPGPNPRRRRRDRPVAERRDRGSPPADPGARGGSVRYLVAITERADQLAGPGGGPLHRAGADRGSLPAGTGPLGQHDRADGRRRCPGPPGQPAARVSPPRISPSIIRAAVWGES